MRNKKSVVYVTRPIQYLNVMNIQELEDDCILLLENSFSGFSKVLEVAKDDKRWKEIVTVRNFKDVMRWLFLHQLAFSKFYTFTDNGVSWQILYNLLFGVDIVFYEEGAATYIPRKISGIKKILYSIVNPGKIANKVYLGYNNKVKRIYVYDVVLHNNSIGSSKQVLPFGKPLFELAKSRVLASFYYSDYHKFKNKKVLLYITSWDFNDGIGPILNEYSDYLKILKPHPHFEGSKEILSKFDEVIDATCLAEFLISDVMNEAAELVIVHQCSTCILHLDILNNVKVINLVSKYSDYDSYITLENLKNKK